MAKATCRLAAMVVAAMTLVPATGEANSRVRTHSPLIAAVIREAVQRSDTFRRIVEIIDASDGLVYVEQGRCGHGVRACLALTVKQAGPSRLLRVVVDVRKADWDLMGSIGHELQHAVEVLRDPSVSSTGAIYMFYRREGETSGDRFETPGAIQVGNTIRQEARRR